MRRNSTGTDVFNRLLGGGYESDAITTIYGPAGAGKTNLALLAAIETARKGKKVLFIDTEGGYSVDRLKQLAPNDYKKVLDKMVFLRPTNFDEQKTIFEKLSQMVNAKFGVVIVDTLTMLYRLELARGKAVTLNRELGRQLGLLTEIARKKKVPILLTNQVYSSFDERENSNGVRMVGGDIFAYSSKCLVELQITPDNKRRAILRKHRSLPCEIELLFQIVQEGIAPVETGVPLK